jgi:pimeloyl-ACP methyl ester carboxylesterase
LRRSGKLLEMGKEITVPVVAIHGDYDSHPAEGVEKPLSAILKDFHFILLEKCGHKPWIERQARERFYTILEGEL